MKYLLFLSWFTCAAQAADLNHLIVNTLSQHPDIAVQEANIDIAQTQETIALHQHYPTFSVSLENATATADSDINYSGAEVVTTFRIQQPLYTFGRLTAGYDKSKLEVSRASILLEETKLDLAQQVLSAWGDWYLASLRIVALQKSQLTHEELKNSVTRRAEKGASSPSEVRLSEARLAQIIAQLEATKLQQNAARVTLSQLVGYPLTNESAITQQLRFELSDEASLLQQGFDNSMQLMRSDIDMNIALQEIKERAASTKPEVYLRAEHQRGDFSATDIPFATRVFIGVQSNFGAGLSAGLAVSLAEQQTKTLAAEVFAIKRKLTEQVQLEITQIKSLNIRQNALELSLSANTDIAAAFNRQFLAGRRSWVEVMNTARELSQAELELADLKAAKVLSYWRLSFLVQGLDRTLLASQPVKMN